MHDYNQGYITCIQLYQTTRGKKKGLDAQLDKKAKTKVKAGRNMHMRKKVQGEE